MDQASERRATSSSRPEARPSLRIALSGPPGAGRSTFLAVFARELGRGRLPGLTWRTEPVALDPALADALARLDAGYPVRVGTPVELEGVLAVAADAGPPGAARAAVEAVIAIADAPSEVEPRPDAPIEGWLALVPARAVDGPPLPPPDWDRSPAAPLALGVSQADRLDAEAPVLYLDRAWPEWAARAQARTAPCFRFGVSAYGRAHADDPARPARDAAPTGLVEPVAWLVRALHDARWKAVEDAVVQRKDVGLAARAFLAVFPVSPHRRRATQLARGTPGELFARATPSIAALALVIAIAAALRSFGVMGAPPPIVAESTGAPRAGAAADQARLLIERAQLLVGRSPQTVEECDQIVYGLSFVAELAALDPTSAELPAVRRACLERVRALIPDREKLVQLRRAAQDVRDWTELVDVIDKLLAQGSRGPAHEKLRVLRQVYWNAWAARTRDGIAGHDEVARELDAFLARCRPLSFASEELKVELAEANRFVLDRGLWAQLSAGGTFGGIHVVEVAIHRECEGMREKDGSARLGVNLGGIQLTGYQDFPACGPDGDWYRYDFATRTPPLKFAVPAGGVDFAVEEHNTMMFNGMATVRITSPLELFGLPLGRQTRTIDIAYNGMNHVRVTLAFNDAHRLVLAPYVEPK